MELSRALSHVLAVFATKFIATVVAQCERGFSWYLAIAVALNKLLGYEVVQEQLAEANTSVMKTMLAMRPKKK